VIPGPAKFYKTNLELYKKKNQELCINGRELKMGSGTLEMFITYTLTYETCQTEIYNCLR
jgi:hypothetical protein